MNAIKNKINKNHNYVKNSLKMDFALIRKNVNLHMDHINLEKIHKLTQSIKLNNVEFLLIKAAVCTETDVISFISINTKLIIFKK
jgi:hypothetical protein